MVGVQHEGFIYDVEAEVILTPDETKSLHSLSASHYDWRCIHAGKVGGFIHGLMNCFVWFEVEGDIVPSKLSWDQVDTLCKILEQSRTDDQRALYWEMRKLLSSMSDEQRRLNDLP